MGSMFQNSVQPQINGGNFNIFQTDSKNEVGTNRHRGLTGLTLLREYCALGALLDSSERFNPPRCAEDTREGVIEEIMTWIKSDEDAATMTWLYGGAGAGKSAIGQTVAEICAKEGRHGGSFFLSRTASSERSDGDRVISTLVFQLIEVIPELKPHIVETINRHESLFERSRKSQLELLFVQPLAALPWSRHRTPPTSSTSSSQTLAPSSNPFTLPKGSKFKSRSRAWLSSVFKKRSSKREIEMIQSEQPGPSVVDVSAHSTGISTQQFRPRLILIDGLDECNGHDVQVDLLQIIASVIPQLPFPFRFLIASRPEAHIMRAFNHDPCMTRLDIRRIDLGDDENAEDDIRRFLIRGFQEIHRVHPLKSFLKPDWPSSADIEVLVQKSSCHFIYASTALKYIQYPRGRPDERLEVILGLSAPPAKDKPFGQLDALYRHIFLSVEEADRETIYLILGMVVISGRNDLDYRLKYSPAFLEDYLKLRAGEVNQVLEPLFSLVALPEHREDNIKILHASLFDFLLDHSRSGDLQLDLAAAHDKLALYHLSLLLKDPPDPTQRYEASTYDYPSRCWDTLGHSYSARLSEELKSYLRTFDFLYDVLIHPDFLPQNLLSRESPNRTHTSSLPRVVDLSGYVPVILQLFFCVLNDKDLENGQELHILHTEKVEQQLRSILKDRKLRIVNDQLQSSLFTNAIYRSRDRVYRAFIETVLNFADMGPREILADRSNHGGPGNTAYCVQAHYLVILLPIFTSEELSLCRGFFSYLPSQLDGEDELLEVLRRTFGEYLERVAAESEP